MHVLCIRRTHSPSVYYMYGEYVKQDIYKDV